MELARCQGEVEKVVRRTCKRFGVEVVGYYKCDNNPKYPDSVSLYFELNYNDIPKKIRISNHTHQHKTVVNQRLLSSRTVSAKTTLSDIEKFVENQIRQMQRWSLYQTLNNISKIA